MGTVLIVIGAIGIFAVLVSARSMTLHLLFVVMGVSIAMLATGIVLLERERSAAAEEKHETPVSCQQAYDALRMLSDIGSTPPNTPERREADFWEDEFQFAVNDCRKAVRTARG